MHMPDGNGRPLKMQEMDNNLLSAAELQECIKYLSDREKDKMILVWEEEMALHYRASFQNFLAFVFETVNPGQKYKHNWHIDMMTEYMGACETGELKRLIINMPPRMLKSITCSVAWPAWLLGNNPERRMLCASYAQKLAIKLSVDCRVVIEHPFYRKMFPTTIISSDQNEKGRFVTTARGHRIITSTGSGTVGEGGNFLIADDIHSPADAKSDVIRKGQLDWFDTSFSNRLDDKKTGVIVLVMQRLHGDDLTGHLLEKGYTRVKIPIENPGKTISFRRFERKFVYSSGALLQPEMMGRKEIDHERTTLGEYGFAGQYMQEPVPAGGGILKRPWFRLYPAFRDDGSPNPFPRLTFIIDSYDTAFTEKNTGDPTAKSTWGIFNGNSDPEEDPLWCMLLLDCWKENLGFPELRKKVMLEYKTLYGPNSKAVNLILVEEKGSGKSLLQELKLAKLPIRSYNPGKADKVSRAHTASPFVEAGRVFVLESENKSGTVKTWALPFMKEVTEFPYSQDGDDYTDTLTQCVIAMEHLDLLSLDTVQQNVEDPEEVDYSQEEGGDDAIYG